MNAFKIQRIKDFVEKHGVNILQAIKGKNIYFPLVVAQLCAESTYGTDNKAVKYNNFSGIRNLNGYKVPLSIGTSPAPGNYAIYASSLDYLKSYVGVISLDRYRQKGMFTATSPEDQLNALAYGGYCQDPPEPEKYIKLVTNIMDDVKRIYPTLGKIV